MEGSFKLLTKVHHDLNCYQKTKDFVSNLKDQEQVHASWGALKPIDCTVRLGASRHHISCGVSLGVGSYMYGVAVNGNGSSQV